MDMIYQEEQAGKPAKKGKAIFGGSFDPIHLGHLAIAEAALDQLPVDEVIFMPTRLRYYKKSGRVSSDEARYDMLTLAVKNRPGMSVSRLELDTAEERNYTVDTLARLSVEHPDWEIFFILGGDSLAYIHTWRQAQILLREAIFAAAVRDDVDREKLKALMEGLKERFPGSRFALLEIEPNPLSSTAIRRAAAEGEPLTGMVTEEVEMYIQRNHIYRQVPEEQD